MLTPVHEPVMRLTVRSASTIFLFGAHLAAGQSLRVQACDVRAKEEAAIRSAPQGTVTRVSERILRIRTTKGEVTFADTGRVPGYDGGLAYEYCGFDVATGFHLVSKLDMSEYSGVLLSDKGGPILPAGFKVLFSDDRSRYLAVWQWEGRESEDWTVHDAQGAILWTGNSGISRTETGDNPGWSYGSFVSPHWTADNQLKATVSCWKIANEQTVTLTKETGRYNWLPAPVCRQK